MSTVSPATQTNGNNTEKKTRREKYIYETTKTKFRHKEHWFGEENVHKGQSEYRKKVRSR